VPDDTDADDADIELLLDPNIETAPASVCRRVPDRRHSPAVLTGQPLPGCILHRRSAMKFQQFSFGQIRIDGIDYGYDIVIDRGEIRRRKKKPSKKFRDSFGHTPLSLEEEIPWKCHRLVVGTGTGALPVMDEVRREAERRKVELIIHPTEEAIEFLKRRNENTNAILHVTC
jgi:hypothetical protein